jgi:hypothetical protein
MAAPIVYDRSQLMSSAPSRTLVLLLLVAGCGEGLSLYGSQQPEPEGTDGAVGLDATRHDAGSGPDATLVADATAIEDASSESDAEIVDAAQAGDDAARAVDAAQAGDDAATAEDAAGLPDAAPKADGGGKPDVGAGHDAALPPDAAMPPDAATLPFTCEANGTATRCFDGGCVSLGPCPLGCDQATERCLVPSNVPASEFAAASADLTLIAAVGPIAIDTDTGAITGKSGMVLRAAGEGVDSATQTSFKKVIQTGGSKVGVFALGNLSIASGLTVVGVGSLPLVILANGTITINGTIDIGANAAQPGPGGFAGGLPGFAGGGPCGGPVGPLGTIACPQLCAAGGGGGGNGGAGGEGGPAILPAYSANYPPTPGGTACGDATLEPLVGGSGGAGGTIPDKYPSPEPGAGGGGGGAIQLSATVGVHVTATGRITAPGDGGGKTISAGGAGGGSGGAILLEAPVIQVAVGAVLAANGGGGGGGDCT